MANILYVDDEPSVGQVLDDTLTRAGHRAIGAQNAGEALQVLTRESVDLVISDFRMPGLTGLEFLALIRQEGYEMPLIMLTGYASVEHAVEAIRAGAVNYITKPVRPAQLELAVEQALHCVTLQRENQALKREVLEYRNARAVVGGTPAIREILQTVAMVAPTRAHVLVQGERGTGKELIAREIHDRSERREQPFVVVDCAALPRNLIESALFGHERGAFAGASRRVAGALERAHGGTLLLDEVTDLRPEVQTRLARALQDHEFERVGGTSPVRVDVRVIATSSAPVAELVASGRFRQDLFFALGVVAIEVPALRERPADVPLLAHWFARRAAADAGKVVTGLSAEALEVLQSCHWPGNVAELRHAVERAVVMSHDETLQASLFSHPHPAAGGNGTASRAASGQRGAATGNGARSSDSGVPDAAHAVVLETLNVDEAERALIQRALEVTGGNRTRTAQLLGISVRTLRNKLNGPSRSAVAAD